MSSSDGCPKTCWMLPIVSTISNSNRSTVDSGFSVGTRRRYLEGFVTVSILQMTSAFLLLWECPVSLKKVLSSAASAVGALSPSYLFTVHFISFSSSSAVSLYPTRATLSPLDLPQNDLSVESDPLSLSGGRCFPCQSLTNGGQVTVAPSSSPQQQEIVSSYLDSNSRFCWQRPMGFASAGGWRSCSLTRSAVYRHREKRAGCGGVVGGSIWAKFVWSELYNRVSTERRLSQGHLLDMGENGQGKICAVIPIQQQESRNRYKTLNKARACALLSHVFKGAG